MTKQRFSNKAVSEDALDRVEELPEFIEKLGERTRGLITTNIINLTNDLKGLGVKAPLVYTKPEFVERFGTFDKFNKRFATIKSCIRLNIPDFDYKKLKGVEHQGKIWVWLAGGMTTAKSISKSK